MQDFPTGTVTFLFTDIEDSSRLWDESPNAMKLALERHDNILRSGISSNNGYVFTTAGDSFAAAFQSANAAAQGALDIQAAIGAQDWSTETPIRVRIGLHSGEAYERDGDYFGPVVNRAARIEAAGHGDQTLMSEITSQMLGGPAAEAWHITELGQHHLKGLAQPESVCQLDRGRYVEFAPLTALHAATNNLGKAPDLIGREDDIRNLVGLVREHRLVTLTGIGGVGKTSLAEAVAHQVLGSYGEVWFVALSPLKNLQDVVTAVARAVGVTGVSDSPDSIAAVLKRRDEILLVLDNCEHLADAVAEVVEALAAAPNVTTLATSRIELEADNEQIMRLSPLGVSDPATDLFVRQACRRSSSFTATAEDRHVIEAICNQVDGIPLAIVLAAAKSGSMDVATILARLSDLLSSPGRRRRGEARHHTMTAAIDWSINLIEPDIAAGLGACAVFAGTFDMKAAEAVVPVATNTAAFLVIDELVAHSLIEPVRTDTGIRYRLLEPVRQRASETTGTDLAAVRHAHLEHYLDRLEAAYETLATTDSGPILELVDLDFANLRTAHRWALEVGRIDDDLRLYRPLNFTVMHDNYEPGEWALETVRLLGTARPEKMQDAVFAAIATALSRGDERQLAELDQSGALATFTGDLAAASDGFEALATGKFAQAAEIFSQLSTHDPYISFVSWMMGGIAINLKPDTSVKTVRDYLSTGLVWARSIGARNFEAALLEQKAHHEVFNGDPHLAMELAVMAETQARALGMHHFVGLTMLHQTRASLLGVPSDRNRADLLVEAIGTANSSGSARLSLALDIAARHFAAEGIYQLAALCDRPNDDPVPWARLSLDKVPDEVRRSADEQVRREQLELTDIAAIATQALLKLA